MIDWSRAPDWAQVVIQAQGGNLLWAPQWGGEFTAEYLETGGAHMVSMVAPHRWTLVEHRPWDGEGFPPEGRECEFNANWAHIAGGESWHKVTVMYISDENYIVRRDDAPEGELAEICGMVCPHEMARFRPLRTLSQLEQERQDREEVLEMLKAIGADEDSPAAAMIAKLQRAGFGRKVAP